MSEKKINNIRTEIRITTNEETAKLKEKLKQEVETIKEEEINNIRLPKDHQDKYNVDVSKANEKMAKIGELKTTIRPGEPTRDGNVYSEDMVAEMTTIKKEEEKRIKEQLSEELKGDKVVSITVDEFTDIETYKDEDTGTILHKRTKRDYKAIWKAFCEQEAEDFKKIMGYGKKAIKKVGIKKFIDAMDWRNPNEVSKYKTDKLHVVICPSCKNEFGVYEQNIGLCHKCVGKYDMDRFWATYKAVGDKNAAEAQQMINLFFSFHDFREKYRIKTNKERVMDMAKEEFSGVDTFRFLMEAIVVAKAEGMSIGDFRKQFRHLCLDIIKKDKDKENFEKFYIDVLSGINNDDWHNTLMKRLYDMIHKQQKKYEENNK